MGISTKEISEVIKERLKECPAVLVDIKPPAGACLGVEVDKKYPSLALDQGASETDRCRCFSRTALLVDDGDDFHWRALSPNRTISPNIAIYSVRLVRSKRGNRNVSSVLHTDRLL